jgi:hypothetical protein
MDRFLYVHDLPALGLLDSELFAKTKEQQNRTPVMALGSNRPPSAFVRAPGHCVSQAHARHIPGHAD